MDIKFVKSEGTTFTLSIPSLFFKDQLTKRGHVSYIQQKLFEISTVFLKFLKSKKRHKIGKKVTS